MPGGLSEYSDEYLRFRTLTPEYHNNTKPSGWGNAFDNHVGWDFEQDILVSVSTLFWSRYC